MFNNYYIPYYPAMDWKYWAGLGAATFGVGLAYYVYSTPRNLPPGPWGWPVVGYIEPKGVPHWKHLADLGDKYGDVVTTWTGGWRYTVTLNSYEAAKEAFITRGCAFNNRDTKKMTETIGFHDDLASANYTDAYISARKFAINSIRNSGMNDGSWDLKFGGEFEDLAEVLRRSGGQDLDIEELLRDTLANVISLVIVGKRYQRGQKDLRDFITSSVEFISCFFQLINAENTYFPKSFFLTRRVQRKFKESMNKVTSFLEPIIHEHELTFDPNHVRDLVDVYIKHGELQRLGVPGLAHNLLLFFPDSVSTTASLLTWIIVYLMKFSDYQEVLHDEVMTAKGSSGGLIVISDKSKLPRIRAFINEVFRVVTPSPLNAPSRPIEATTFRGYSIPHYVNLEVNILAIHRDSRHYENPEEFRPERFLHIQHDGQIEGFLPFGIGRRACIGEQLVRAELLFFTANLVRNFKFVSSDASTLPSIDSEYCQMYRAPTPFKAKVVERQ